MIKIKGELYRTELDKRRFEREFDRIESLFKYLSDELPYGKKSLELPWIDKTTGLISAPCSFSAAIRFKKEDSGRYPMTECIYQIEENGKILFSDGTLTGGQAHIGSRISEMFEALEEYKNAGFPFAD